MSAVFSALLPIPHRGHEPVPAGKTSTPSTDRNGTTPALDGYY
jgi:hypothetical protein